MSISYGKTYPNKSEYEKALETVKQYEERQATLKRLEKDLSFHLSKFDTIKFKIDKKKGRVIFTGVIDGQIKIGESVCAIGDDFNETIGKLIAIKKSLGLDISDVVEHVETTGRLTFNLESGFIKTVNQIEPIFVEKTWTKL